MRADTFMSKELNISVLSDVIILGFISIYPSSSDVSVSILLPTIFLVMMF